MIRRIIEGAKMLVSGEPLAGDLDNVHASSMCRGLPISGFSTSPTKSCTAS